MADRDLNSNQYTLRRCRTASRRGWIRPVAVVGSAIGAVMAAAIAFAWIASGPVETPAMKLDVALRLAVKGQTFDAIRLVDSIESEKLANDSQRAKLALLRGIGEAELANRSSLKQIVYKHLDAAEIELKHANELTFPNGFEGLGNYYLGSTLYRLQKFVDAEPFLDSAITRYPIARFDAANALVDLKLSQPTIDIAATQNAIDRWRNLPAIASDQIDRAILAQARLKLLTKQLDTAVEIANQIKPQNALRSEAECLIASALWEQLLTQLNREDNAPIKLTASQIAQAEDIQNRLTKVLRSAALSVQDKSRAYFLKAEIARMLGRQDEAISLLANLHSSAPQSIEALAAAVTQIDLFADLARWDDANQTLRMLTSNFGQQRWYNNTWQPITKLAETLRQVGGKFLKARAFEPAISYSQTLPPFLTAADRLRIAAPAYHGLGEQLGRSESAKSASSKLVSLNSSQQEVGKLQAQQAFANAGKAYEQLANLQMIAADYGQLLWTAIEDYSAAQNFNRSNLLIDCFVDVHSKDRRPLAYLKKAENLQKQGNNTAAIQTLNKCITNFSDDPLSYEARFRLATIYLDQFEYTQAKDLFLANLYDGNLTPQSPIWQNSLFDLGLLYCRLGLDEAAKVRSLNDSSGIAEQKNRFDQMQSAQGNLLQGVQRLEEASARFPNDPRRFESLYRIAESYRVAAEWPKLQLDTSTLASAETRENHRQQRDQLLQSSQKSFAALREQLNAAGDLTENDPQLKRIFRNSFLGEADLLYEGQQYELALSAYRKASNRFLMLPIALEGLTRASQCLVQLGRNEEALRTLNQASEVLNRIDDTDPAAFAQSTRATKAEWRTFLDWMKTTI